MPTYRTINATSSSLLSGVASLRSAARTVRTENEDYGDEDYGDEEPVDDGTSIPGDDDTSTPSTGSDDYAATSDTTGALSEGASVTGSIESEGDIDWFRVSLTAGQTYVISLRGEHSDGGTLGDPMITSLYTSDGTVIEDTYNDDNGSSRDSQVTYTATTTGTFFIGASAYSTSTGTYTLSLGAGSTTNTEDDFPASAATGGTVGDDGTARGNIESEGDVDWFRVTLTAGQSYAITLRGAPSDAGTLADPMIAGLYTSDGTLIDDTTNDDANGRESAVSFTATTSGTYYIAAQGYSDSTGTYTLGVMSLRDDFTATTATTGALTVGTPAEGNIGVAEDVDWFRVTLRAGTIYRIRQEGAPSGNGTLADTYLRGIYNATGQRVGRLENDDSMGSQDSEIQFRPTSAGTYYIAAGAYGSNTGSYRMTVEAVSTSTASDIDDSAETTGTVTVGGTVSGAVDVPEDVDWYGVALEANQTYEITLLGAATDNGTLVDPLIEGIYTSGGQLIDDTGNDDDGESRNSRVIFTPTEAGTYYIAARGYWYETGSFTLSVKAGSASSAPADTIAEDTSTSGTIAPGTPVSGTIDTAGDIDWFRASLTRGTTYTITLNAASGSEALSDPFFRGVYTATGGQLPNTENDDTSGTNRNSTVTFTAPETGTFYLAAGGYGDGTGAYTLAVTPRAAPADDYANTVSASGRYGQLTVGGEAGGTIGTAGDVDLFRVQLDANKTYIINLQGAATGEGSLADPKISGILNASGQSVLAASDNDNDGSANETVTFRPTQAGTYYIGAASGNSNVGSYRLNIDQEQENSPDDRGKWTIMVYVNGDNDLEQFALADVNEMEAVTLPNGVRVCVMVDRHPAYASNEGNWNNTKRGLIRPDTNTNAITSPLTAVGEKDMGSAATLTEFINWGTSQYQADNYALVVWDHGGGLSGTSWDETSNSNLSVKDIASAIRASTRRRLDFVGFDTCLQGMVEQTVDLQSTASVVVASEELEPGDGWDYTGWLNRLRQNPQATPRELAAAAVESYGQFYRTPDEDSPQTLSATDTSSYANLVTRLNAFVTATTGASQATWQSIAEAREAAPTFGKQSYNRDLYAFMSAVAQKVSTSSIVTAARAVMTAIDETVIANFANGPNRHGLSIYLPAPGTDIGHYTASSYPVLSSINWRTFLTNFSNGVRGSSRRSADLVAGRTTATQEALATGLATASLGTGEQRLGATAATASTTSEGVRGLLAAVA